MSTNQTELTASRDYDSIERPLLSKILQVGPFGLPYSICPRCNLHCLSYDLGGMGRRRRFQPTMEKLGIFI